LATVITPLKVAVAAPDAATAFMLEHRLANLAPAVVGCGDEWTVELEADESRLDEIEAAVRRWLWEEALPETTLVAADCTRHLGPRRPA
jgi:hypothetical protein